MSDIQRLPDAELDVMKALWSCGNSADRNSINARLEIEHPMAPTTLLTLLSRLAEKDFISIEKQGRVSLYSAIISEREYRASQSRRFVDRLFGGSMSAFACALCDSGLSSEDIEELRMYLDEQKKADTAAPGSEK